MPIFEGFNKAKGSITWQDLFGYLLQDQLGPRGYHVYLDRMYHPQNNTLSVPEAREYQPLDNLGSWFHQQSQNRHDLINPQQHPRCIEAIFIERLEHNHTELLPDGFDYLKDNNLLVFSPHALEMIDLQRLAAYIHDYSSYRGIHNIREELGLLAVAPRFSHEILGELNPEELMPGFYEYDNLALFHMVLTREMTAIPENILWHIFSFDPGVIPKALDKFVLNHPSYQEVLDEVLLRLRKEHIIT